jgi:hypothetical protein
MVSCSACSYEGNTLFRNVSGHLPDYKRYEIELIKIMIILRLLNLMVVSLKL